MKWIKTEDQLPKADSRVLVVYCSSKNRKYFAPEAFPYVNVIRFDSTLVEGNTIRRYWTDNDDSYGEDEPDYWMYVDDIELPPLEEQVNEVD